MIIIEDIEGMRIAINPECIALIEARTTTGDNVEVIIFYVHHSTLSSTYYLCKEVAGRLFFEIEKS